MMTEREIAAGRLIGGGEELRSCQYLRQGLIPDTVIPGVTDYSEYNMIII